MPVNLLNENDLNRYLCDIVYRGGPVIPVVSDWLSQSDKIHLYKDAIVRAMTLQWMKHRLKNHLKQDTDAPFFMPVMYRDSLPDWAKFHLKQGGTVYKFNVDHIPYKLQEKIEYIRDFLYASAESYVDKLLIKAEQTNQQPKARLDYLKTSNELNTFSKAYMKSVQWHKLMELHAHKQHFEQMLLQQSLSGTQKIMTMSDGLYITQLLSPEALDFETQCMGHCIGTGGYDADVLTGAVQIYSLRDKNGMPHVTFEVKNGCVKQCKGKGNKAPILKYIPYIQEFVNANHFEIEGDIKHMGLIKQDGRYYNIWDLPQGFVVKCDIDLSEMGLTQLPNLSDVRVKGDFICNGNVLQNLQGAPKYVEGHFDCHQNTLTTLEGAPQIVLGSFICCCNRLATLNGAPSYVGGVFDCEFNQLENVNGKPSFIGSHFYAPRAFMPRFYAESMQRC